MITITPDNYNLNLNDIDNSLSSLKSYVQMEAKSGRPVHEVEKDIFRRVLEMGAKALAYFIGSQGDGNIGDTFTAESGAVYKRLSNRTRGYQSVFGRFELTRAVYGTQESKKIEAIPLDTRLQFPPNEHSYLLQEWSQIIAVEVPFKKSMDMLRSILPVSMTVDTLEQTNQSYSQYVESFRKNNSQNIDDHLQNMNVSETAALKEHLLVLSADGKGVPIKHASDGSRIDSHQKNKGPKPDRKRMAVVGASYVVAPYSRTPEAVLVALFRDTANDTTSDDKQARPKPLYKSVVANLTRELGSKRINATSATFSWLYSQKDIFSDHVASPPIFLMDGQPSLWSEVERQMPGEDRVEILDLLHATSYIWDIAHLLYPSNSTEIWEFMKDRVLRLLKGEVKSVVSGARQMATKRKLSKDKVNKMEVACHYLEKNQHRMRYDDYLSLGFPIASGVIEGACRHFVKDRMERAGMQWTINGAQSMLDVRAVKLNGDWDRFVKHRIKQELDKNHPHKNKVDHIKWPMAA